MNQGIILINLVYPESSLWSLDYVVLLCVEIYLGFRNCQHLSYILNSFILHVINLWIIFNWNVCYCVSLTVLNGREKIFVHSCSLSVKPGYISVCWHSISALNIFQINHFGCTFGGTIIWLCVFKKHSLYKF